MPLPGVEALQQREIFRERREDRYHFCGLGELDMLQTAEQRLRRLKHRTINYHPRNMVTNMKVLSCSSTTSWKQKVPFHSLFVSCEEGEVKWNQISKSLKIPFPKLSRVRVGRQCRHEHVCNGATTRWSLFCWGSFYERRIFTQTEAQIHTISSHVIIMQARSMHNTEQIVICKLLLGKLIDLQ